jgi:hypothetical protein
LLINISEKENQLKLKRSVIRIRKIEQKKMTKSSAVSVSIKNSPLFNENINTSPTKTSSTSTTTTHITLKNNDKDDDMKNKENNKINDDDNENIDLSLINSMHTCAAQVRRFIFCYFLKFYLLIYILITTL